MEGLIFGGAYLRREICISNEEGYLPFLLCFTLYSRANSKYKPPWGAYIRRGDLTESFLRYGFGGPIHRGAYFRNFTVYNIHMDKLMR